MEQSNRKKWIIVTGIIAVLAGLVGLLVACYLLFWAPPSEQDFAEAKADAKKIATYSGTTLQREFAAKVSSEYKTGKSQQALVDAAAAEKQKTIDALNARMALAEEIKASRVVRDKEVAAAFNTYLARETRYSKYIRDYLDAFPMYMSSFDTCIDVFGVTRNVQDVTTIAAAHTSASKDCLQDLSVLKSSKITPFADYGRGFEKIIVERQKIFDSLARKEINADKSTSDKIAKLGDNYSKINPTQAIQDYGKAAVFNGELNKLIEVLGNKETLAKEA